MKEAPGVAALQRALLWSVGAGGAIVFIEPSPYELATLAAMIVFFATGLRMRLAFVPLLMLLFTVNIGYTICAAYLMDKTEIVNWIMTSWYMAVTVIFFAMVFSEDTAARLDLLRRGLIFGAVVASSGRHRRLFPSGARRARVADALWPRSRHLQGSERAVGVPDFAGAVHAAERCDVNVSGSRCAARSRSESSGLRCCWPSLAPHGANSS